MKVKVHWVIDGIAEVEAESLEDAEKIVNETVRFRGNNPDIEEKWCKRNSGKGFLPDLKRIPNFLYRSPGFEPIRQKRCQIAVFGKRY